MNKPSRKEARALLVVGLRNALTNISADNIIGYQPNLTGEFPVIAVLSAGSRRPPMTARGTMGAFALRINVFVRREATDWSREQAEDLLDDLEAQIAEHLEKVRGETIAWKSLDYDTMSEVAFFVPQAGIVYVVETIHVTVSVLR